jgi:crotonobetainyl-CoA:carnitine CoA-transferase CaiB-like acyl-CoA transferase
MSAEGALKDIRVLDLGHVIAGPFAATLLADLGADVVKIEHPLRGDTIRSLGPRHNDVPLWWKVAGRNKRSLTLNLSKPEGQRLLLGLVEVSDVLVENFRPGTLERWSLGPAELWEANPRLIILRISGHGQADAGGRPGFGRVGEAMSGVVHLTGEPDGRPLHVGFSLGDTCAGLMGALGILAALHAREQTGVGDVVDVALFEPLMRMIEWQLPMAQVLGTVVQRAGNAFPIGYAVGGSYLTADRRWVTISAATQDSIHRLLTITGGEEVANDPKMADFAARSTRGRMKQIDEIVSRWVGEHLAEKVIQTLEAQDVAVGFVLDSRAILDEPYFRERGSVVEVDDPQLGSLPMPGVQPRLQRSPGAVKWAGPNIGEHNEEILGDLLGLSADEIAELSRLNVV